MSDLILKIKDLKKTFAENVVFAGLSLDVHKGEFVSVLGPSGCGKTVLLRMLAGLLQKTSGEIKYHFTDPGHINIGMAFQRSPLFPWLDVLENITICMNNRPLSAQAKESTALEYLQKANLGKFTNHYPAEISGGMAQRVNVLRSFCSGSELILMDEPFVSLDFIQRTQLQQFTLDIWNKEQKTILFVTHNVHEAIILSDRILVMAAEGGRIVGDFRVGIGRPRNVDEVREKPEYLHAFKEINKLLTEEVRKLSMAP